MAFLVVVAVCAAAFFLVAAALEWAGWLDDSYPCECAACKAARAREAESAY